MRADKRKTGAAAAGRGACEAVDLSIPPDLDLGIVIRQSHGRTVGNISRYIYATHVGRNRKITTTLFNRMTKNESPTCSK
jgi:hypothetical protein